jgi:hypothetical protein
MEQHVAEVADILVRGIDNDIKLVVEVKGRSHSSADWAAKYRQNLSANCVLPKSKFFLLALPDFLYLWKDENSAEFVLPNFTIKTFKVLQPYLTRSETEPSYIAGEGLRLALTSWLREATFSSKRPPVGSDSYRLLIESGLLDEINKAEVIAEVRL